MKLAATDIARLSSLLDDALDVPSSEREAWLAASLGGDLERLGPTLRELLAKEASHETGDLIDRLPVFTVARDAAADASFHAGDTVGPYRLQRELGRGGMGEVWLAERSDGHLKRAVALKLPMLSARRSVLVQRFARERDIVGSLAHPHIARLYDAGLADDGQPYLALEYVEGKPITTYCDEAALDARARIALLCQVIDAVQYAHANLVIHRDLKPSNVLVTAAGQAMLLDFGIAKLLADEGAQAQETELTRLGGRAMSLHYAAPEQVAGGAISTATDIWALGVLLYQLLAGCRPFERDSRAAIEQAIVNDQPARPSQPPGSLLRRLPRGAAGELDTIVMRALKKAPQERYATVAALAEDLRRWRDGEPVLAQPDSAWYRLRKLVGRHRAASALGVVVAGVVLAAVVVSLWQASIARREARTALSVETFLREVFNANSSHQADPEAARRTTARELLDIGARRVDQGLADAPQARARVLGVLAGMYDDLSLYEPALQLLRQQVAVLRQIEPADSALLAEALRESGRIAGQANEPAAAREALAEASRILDRRGETDTLARGQLESAIAGSLLIGRGPDVLPHAERAATILRRHGPSLPLIRALLQLSYSAADADRVDTSLAAVREALAVAQSLPPNVGAAALPEIYKELASLQVQRFELADAEDSLRHAHAEALRREGPQSIQTLNMAVDLGQHLYDNGRFAQALAVFVPAAKAAEARMAAGDRTWVPVLALAYRGAARVKSGDIEGGRVDLARALDSPAALQAQPQVHTYLLRLLAETELARGDDEAAEALLGKAEAVLGSGKDAAMHDQQSAASARLLLAQHRGDATTIDDIIRRFKLDQDKPGAGPDQQARGWWRVAVARAAAGQPELALAAAQRTLQAVAASRTPQYQAERERRALLVAADVHLARGQPQQALPLLLRASQLADGGSFDTARSPEVARTRVLLARALLALGRRDEAVVLAGQAQAIVARHARLAPMYVRPLKDLHAQLAGRAASH